MLFLAIVVRALACIRQAVSVEADAGGGGRAGSSQKNLALIAFIASLACSQVLFCGSGATIVHCVWTLVPLYRRSRKRYRRFRAEGRCGQYCHAIPLLSVRVAPLRSRRGAGRCLCLHTRTHTTTPPHHHRTTTFTHLFPHAYGTCCHAHAPHTHCRDGRFALVADGVLVLCFRHRVLRFFALVLSLVLISHSYLPKNTRAAAAAPPVLRHFDIARRKHIICSA